MAKKNDSSDTPQARLFQAFTKVCQPNEVDIFLRDLLTPAELEEFSQRFEIAVLLWRTQLPYMQVAQQVGTSTTTVTRVARFLFKEPWKGYSLVLHRLYGPSQRTRGGI